MGFKTFGQPEIFITKRTIFYLNCSHMPVGSLQEDGMAVKDAHSDTHMLNSIHFIIQWFVILMMCIN